MVGSRFYDLAYRWGWAPWDAVGVRDELLALLATGEVTPVTHPRAIDLGCGTGANVVELAGRGFDTTGVDFSAVALRKAEARARAAGVDERCRFLEVDLTAPSLPPAVGSDFARPHPHAACFLLHRRARSRSASGERSASKRRSGSSGEGPRKREVGK